MPTLQKPMKIAIIDVLGLVYDGSTLQTKGIGGSEAWAILTSRNLVSLGFDVTVFCHCVDVDAKEGVYDGVNYVDISKNYSGPPFDILIGSRSIVPFVDPKFSKMFGPNTYKVLFAHDTFFQGDPEVERLLVNGAIDKLFTLSDFHTFYLSSCHHGGDRRNPEVLKSKIFMTRNGVERHIPWVDIAKKNRNHFVYNASQTKGMSPLVERIWPLVKAQIPEAKLTVIGGYYRFNSKANPDAQELQWRKYANDPILKGLNITFTGIITQQQIAQILADASFMIYPAAFPETSGISTMEALTYNVPLLTCTFGALEETAIDMACYKIPYAIEPNSLYPNINSDEQVKKFVDMTVQAYRNAYLHSQKMQYCSIIHDVCDWRSIMLQWKQHFFKVKGLYLPVEEYREVQRINRRVHQIFGRRFSNPEEWVHPQTKSEQHIVIITPFYNAEAYIEKCIESVITQDYENYQFVLIDDASTDDGYERAIKYINSLPEPISRKIAILSNGKNRGAVFNQIKKITNPTIGNENSIIMLLDGDDSLVARNDIFQMYNNLYTEDVDFTYGSSWSMVDNIPLIAQPYPPEVLNKGAFRQYKFVWNMPYTHLRTFRKGLLKNVPDSAFQDENGHWLRAGGDTAIFYNAIERAKGIRVVQDIVYNYNDMNPLNDYKVNGKEQTKNANYVMGGTAVHTPVVATTKKLTTNYTIEVEPVTPIPEPVRIKQILIAIPTAKNIEAETFKSIYDLEVPEGYKTFFQYFYGYNIDQIRNLIASWAIHYDYLFSVDSDIVLPKDTLVKMLKANKDIISGVYRQRKRDKQVLEIYERTPNGGSTQTTMDKLMPQGLHKVVGCGFGCVLVKGEVFKKIGFPQFEYHSALKQEDTVSEDTDFCIKAMNKGYEIWCDSSIVCKHLGTDTFEVEIPVQVQTFFQDIPPYEEVLTPEIKDKMRYLSNIDMIPAAHQNYLHTMKQFGTKPKVIYDIGACLLHWTHAARRIWPSADYHLFEANPDCKFLYEEAHEKGYIAVLASEEGKEITFYTGPHGEAGGDTMYKENSQYTPNADTFYHPVTRTTRKLDEIVKQNGLPWPDLIKMDVQGAELDIVKGGLETISHCKDVILELQIDEYNIGAPTKEEVIEFMKSIGFELITPMLSVNAHDADYHFRKD